MSKSSLFIPQKVKVGYQNRAGTYTGRLAYIIYYDNKGKLRKEVSWENWRSKDIEPEEFDNTPTEGFVLNKKVGGYKSGWDFRQSYVRVYDPRGFEFEITVPNLLFILENTSSIKGKGLEGEFVYAWSGTELVLLPTAAPDYIDLTNLNDKRFKNETVKAKDLKVGATYLHTSNSQWVYMGRFDHYVEGYQVDDKWFESYRKANDYMRNSHNTFTHKPGCIGKAHFFYDRESDRFQIPKSLSGLLIDVISEMPAADYAELFESLESQESYSPYDKTKDEKVEYGIDEVRGRVDSAWWSVQFIAADGSAVEVKKSKDREGYTCQFYDYDKRSQMTSIFPHKPHTFWPYAEMIPVPLEDIVEKFKFHYTNEYLANGKFLRRVDK